MKWADAQTLIVLYIEIYNDIFVFDFDVTFMSFSWVGIFSFQFAFAFIICTIVLDHIGKNENLYMKYVYILSNQKAKALFFYLNILFIYPTMCLVFAEVKVSNIFQLFV